MPSMGALPSRRKVVSLVALVAILVGVLIFSWFTVGVDSREAARPFEVSGIMSDELASEGGTFLAAPGARPAAPPVGADGPWLSSLMGDLALPPTAQAPEALAFAATRAGARGAGLPPAHAAAGSAPVDGGGAFSAGGGAGASGGGSRGLGSSSAGAFGAGSGGGNPGGGVAGGNPGPGVGGGKPGSVGGGNPGAGGAGGGPGTGPGSGPVPIGSGRSGGPIVISGEFSPGSSPGELVGDDITLQPDAWLVLEIYGREPGEYDRVVASGELHLDGTLEIALRDGFVPTAGDVFDFFDWGTLTGEFAQIILPDLGDGLDWDTSSLYATGEIGVAGHIALLTPEAVPAPATMILLGLGVAVSALRWRRGGAR